MALDSIETARKEIAKIYIAAFNRVPDEGGLQNWMNQYTAGLMTYAQIATDFTNQAEYIAAYPSYLTSSEYITEIYENVFGRSPDAGGLQNWINQIDNPTVSGISRTTVMYEMLESASAAGNTDGERLDNQAEFGVQSVLDGVPTVAATAQLVNITSNDATVAAATAAVANSANSINGSTFTLTTGADAVTGTVYNDTIIATEDSLSSADVLDGNEGTDTLRYANSDVAVTESGFELSGIEYLQVTADGTGATTFDVTGTTGVTKLTNANSSQNVIFTGVKAVPTVGLSMTGVTAGDTRVTFTSDAIVGTADTLNISLDNVKTITNAAASRIASASNGIETVAITTTGTRSMLFDIQVGQTSVEIAGDKDLSIDDAGITLDGTTNINATEFTGNLTLGALDSATVANDVVVAGGTGNDRVDFSNGFEAGDSFDGNEGTDTIALSYDEADTRTSLTTTGALTDVEELAITDEINAVNTTGDTALDMDMFSGITKVIFEAGVDTGDTVTVDDAVTGITVKVDVDSDDDLVDGTVAVDLKTDGTADEVTFEMSDVEDAVVMTELEANDAETVNISVADGDTAVGVDSLTVTTLDIDDATTLNISGDADFIITNVDDPATPVLSVVNASTMTGDLTISGMNTKATGATITLGAGDDTYNVATSNGADTITLGAGADTIVYNAPAQSDRDMDTITDFVSGTDIVDVRALMGGVGTASSVQFVGNRATFAQAQGALSGIGGTMDAVFQVDEQILWVDSTLDGTLDNNDFRIKLDGVTAITAADLGFTAGVTFTANTVGFNLATAPDSVEDNAVGTEDDTINATVAQMVGATINGLGGADVLNISATAAAGEIANRTMSGIETVNLDNTVEGILVTVGDLAADGGDIATLNGTSDHVQSLEVANTSDLTSTAITNIETLIVTGGTVTMTAAQHNAFATITAAAAGDQITLTTAGTITANDAVATYSVVEGSLVTVGTTAGALAQIITETGVVGTVSTITLGNGTYTGVYTGIDATDIVKVGTTTNVSANTGLNAGAVMSFQNAATAVAGLTLNNTQNGAVTFADTTLAQTVTVNGAADTFSVADGIESYDVIGGSVVTVTATNTAVNIDADNTAASTILVGGNTVTGTYLMANAADVITATTGANISGATITTAEVLNLTGTITMTAAQLAAFTTENAAGAADGVILTTSAAHGTIDVDYEAVTFNGTGADTANFTLADSATLAQSVAVSLAGGGADVITITNAAVDTAVYDDFKVINITGFAADDKIATIETAQSATSTGIFTNNYAGGVLVLADSGVVEIDATAYQAGVLTNGAAVLAWLNVAGVTSTAANDVVTVVAYNGAGTAGIYQMHDVAGASAFDSIELIGTVNMADNGFVGANFA